LGKRIDAKIAFTTAAPVGSLQHRPKKFAGMLFLRSRSDYNAPFPVHNAN
jgi:hypothetical protein